MLKVVEYLVTRKNSTRRGNHEVEVGFFNKMLRYFRYFGNTIVTVNDQKKVFRTDYCGYEHSISTKRAINDYTKYFEERGYKQI